MSDSDLTEIREAADRAVEETIERPWEAVKAQLVLMNELRQLRREFEAAVSMLAGDAFDEGDS
jgi:hypothetical protein